MNKSKKIVNNARNGNIIDIQFIALNEKQQQIEWTFKLWKLYLIMRVLQVTGFKDAAQGSADKCSKTWQLWWVVPNSAGKMAKGRSTNKRN